jgi:hypothetical protein
MKWFMYETEPIEYGEGIAYIEADEGEDLVLKQVEVYGDTLTWATRNAESEPAFEIADVPLSEHVLGSDDEVSGEEFERMWKRARRANS